MVIALTSSLRIVIIATSLTLLAVLSATTFAFSFHRLIGYARGISFLQTHAPAYMLIFQGNPLHYSSSNIFIPSVNSKLFIPQNIVTALLSTTTSEEMNRSVPTIQEFLLNRKHHPTSHIVIGNEAGDADSIISTICYAYIQECAFPNEAKLTPVVSISRGDLQTQRPETVRLLQLSGISPQEQLCYIDDASVLQPDAETNVLNITLVDHNRLVANRPFLNATTTHYTVVGILDHHLDEGYHTDTCTERNIAFENSKALVASTCTLVVELLQNGPCATPYPPSLSLLLLGVILLDSVNMDTSAGKVTERDVTAIQVLVRNTNWEDLDMDARNLLGLSDSSTNQSPNLTTLFQTLQNAKFSPAFWNGLSVRDALRLDYKQFTPSPQSPEVKALGVSTVLQSGSEFWTKSEIIPSIRAYMNDLQIELFGIMFAYSGESGNASDSAGGGLKRELTLIGPNQLFLERLITFLLDEGSLQLKELSETTTGLFAKGDGAPLTVRSFQQMNAAASRKQVVPLLLKFFEETMT